MHLFNHQTSRGSHGNDVSTIHHHHHQQYHKCRLAYTLPHIYYLFLSVAYFNFREYFVSITII